MQHQAYNKSDHFWNLISNSNPLKEKLNEKIVNSGLKIPKNTFSVPIIFISLILSKPLIYFDEFLEGFLKQDYPKQNIILCISDETKNNKKHIKLLHEQKFGDILQTNFELKMVQQRLDALKKFEVSPADFILFLNNSVILNNVNTLKKLVTQDVDVIAPMIRTNVFAPKWIKQCEQWFNKITNIINFPNKEAEGTWHNNKYFVSIQTL